MKTSPNIIVAVAVIAAVFLCVVPAQAEPGISVDPLELEFPNVTPGCTESQVVTITSTGTDPLVIREIEFIRNDFDAYTVTPSYVPITLDPGETQDLVIGFSPPVNTIMLADLLIGSDAGGVFVRIGGDGYGTDPCEVPDIDVSPASHDFGTLEPGDTSSLEVTIANVGTTVLDVLGMNLYGATTAYTLDINGGSNPCGMTDPDIAPGEHCTVEVTFEPVGTDTYVGYLDIEADDPDEPMVEVTLVGSSLTGEPLNISLHIEDALEGIPVNKVVGDFSGPSSHTWVEIVAKLISLSPETTEDIPVVLTIPGDLFGAPRFTSVRDTSGGWPTPVACEDLGGGQYRVTTDLSPVGLEPLYYRKQIVWDFELPNGTPPQNVTVTAEVELPCTDPIGSGTIQILAPGSVNSLIVANRKLLYGHYNEREVTSLLQRLFTEAQGAPASHSPRGVIYYVERYAPRASDWDNTAVVYTDESTANEAAADIDALIEDWVQDATLTVPLDELPGWFMPIAMPKYLLIVGDDDTVPFYRFYDPTNWLMEEQWGVDSPTNPAIRATDENYFFTDNPYADLWGTDWQMGDIELSVGRLLGESAADMLSLLEEGVNWDNGQTGGVVMASLHGFEVGLEPDDGRTAEIADLYDVPELFRAKGFEVRNDGFPYTELRTIDVLGDGGLSTSFRNAANDPAGMDLFFIGGHASYYGSDLPRDVFSPDDTCAAPSCRYHRFDDDHPIAMIVGCHGGIPVPNIDVDGGVDHCMVYDLIHEGARAYIGATGYGYGSADDLRLYEGILGLPRDTCLHQCLFGERLMERFFGNLLEPAGFPVPVSMTIGDALAQAKGDYTFGFHTEQPYEDYEIDFQAIDRKTVTEYHLYGVPWAFIYYPVLTASGLEAGDLAISQPEEQAFTALSQPIVRSAQEGVYTQTFEVNIDSYEVKTTTKGNLKYDHFYVNGGDIAVVPGAPILPYVRSYTLPLPFGGIITEVKVTEIESNSIGTYDIPIAQVRPFSEGGLTYTTVTDIDYPHPKDADLVQYQQTSEGLLFTIFPIQYNPTTGETTFHSRFTVQVTYQSPLPVSVTEFTTDKGHYAPGETISTTTRIANVGDVHAELTAALTIKDALGEFVGTETSTPFSVPSGGSHVLPLSFTGDLEDGAYTVQITLLSSGAIVGGASAAISVLGCEITGLTVPTTLIVGEEGTFQVFFANYTSKGVEGEAFLTIQHSEGGFVQELTPQSISVGAGSTETVTFSWTPSGVSSGQYIALATVVADGQTYGPTPRSFLVISHEVPVDIKPGSCPNSLNIKSKGVLPVAILGTGDFDVTQVNPESVLLEGIAPVRWAWEDVATPFEPFTGKGDCDNDCTAEGPDGNLDLTLKFETRQVVGALGEVQDGECRVVELTGNLYNGTLIAGEDVVLIKNKEK